MASKLTRESWVKWGYVAFAALAAIFGFIGFNNHLGQASEDDAVRNTLRNLYGLAADYSKTHANQPVVPVSSLAPGKLAFAGVRPFRQTVYPMTVTLGVPLQATSADGRRTVVFDPAVK